MRNNNFKIIKYRYIFPVISGFLLSAAFTFKGFWWLSFFALVPLFSIVFGIKLSFKRLNRIIFLFSLSYYVPLMLWLFNMGAILPFSKKKSMIILIFGIFLIGLLQGAYIAVSTAFFVKIRSGEFRDVVFFSALFILGEWFQEITPFLPFSWARTGVLAVPFTPFIQSASLFGSLFISFLILLINGGIAFILINLKLRRRVVFSVITLIAVFSANIVFGIIRINSEKKQSGFDAVVVQGNYSGLDKWNTSSYEMFSHYLRLSEQGISKSTRLVVWPETAITSDFYKDKRFQNELVFMAQKYNVTLIVGAYIDDRDGKSFNSLIAVSPDKTVSEPYCKQILAPFGECFPLAEFFKKTVPSMTQIINNSSSIICAEKPKIINSPLGKIGGIICYESIFPKIASCSVKKGAEILTIASNDSWFGESAALSQHHAHAIMRAVETKRFVIRASNTGISSIISPYGKIIRSAKPFKAGSASGEVYMISDKTLYSRIGNAILLLPFGIIIYSFVKAFKNKGKKRTKK